MGMYNDNGYWDGLQEWSFRALTLSGRSVLFLDLSLYTPFSPFTIFFSTFLLFSSFLHFFILLFCSSNLVCCTCGICRQHLQIPKFLSLPALVPICVLFVWHRTMSSPVPSSHFQLGLIWPVTFEYNNTTLK